MWKKNRVMGVKNMIVQMLLMLAVAFTPAAADDVLETTAPQKGGVENICAAVHELALRRNVAEVTALTDEQIRFLLLSTLIMGGAAEARSAAAEKHFNLRRDTAAAISADPKHELNWDIRLTESMAPNAEHRYITLLVRLHVKGDAKTEFVEACIYRGLRK